MCFGPISKVPLNAAISDSTSSPTNKNKSGSVYSASDISNYRSKTETELKEYVSLGSDQKNTVSSTEHIGIRGAVNIPAASSYSDTKLNANQLAAKGGSLAGSQSQISILQDAAKAISGITLPIMEFGSSALISAIGVASKGASNLASAIQPAALLSPPTAISPKAVAAQAPAASKLSSALAPAPPISVPVPTLEQIGTTPSINISSPDVTVQSLNDVIDSGEF